MNKLLYVLISLLLVSVCFATEINVPADYTSIQDAIDAASSGDTVSVAAGTYVENIVLKDGVAVVGAGADVCTIDGDGTDSVVVCSDCSSQTRLEGFTITNGDAYRGGGMYNQERACPIVSNCTFMNNTTSGAGGGMLNEYISTPKVSDCRFSLNKASAGGGMYNTCLSCPEVSNCTFSYNNASKSGGMGNAEEGTSTITDSFFCSNIPNQVSGDYTDNGGNVISVFCPPRATEPKLFGDSDGDGDVDLIDFAAFVENWLMGVE